MAPELRAIEHAEYMAKSAEHLLQALNDYALACGEDGQEHDPDEICGAEENVAEATRHMRSMIYEFRKRAAKVPNAGIQPSERSEDRLE